MNAPFPARTYSHSYIIVRHGINFHLFVARKLRRGIAVRLRAKVARLFGGVMSQYASMPASLPSGTYSCTYHPAFEFSGSS